MSAATAVTFLLHAREAARPSALVRAGEPTDGALFGGAAPADAEVAAALAAPHVFRPRATERAGAPCLAGVRAVRSFFAARAAGAAVVLCATPCGAAEFALLAQCGAATAPLLALCHCDAASEKFRERFGARGLEHAFCSFWRAKTADPLSPVFWVLLYALLLGPPAAVWPVLYTRLLPFVATRAYVAAPHPLLARAGHLCRRAASAAELLLQRSVALCFLQHCAAEDALLTLDAEHLSRFERSVVRLLRQFFARAAAELGWVRAGDAAGLGGALGSPADALRLHCERLPPAHAALLRAFLDYLQRCSDPVAAARCAGNDADGGAATNAAVNAAEKEMEAVGQEAEERARPPRAQQRTFSALSRNSSNGLLTFPVFFQSNCRLAQLQPALHLDVLTSLRNLQTLAFNLQLLENQSRGSYKAQKLALIHNFVRRSVAAPHSLRCPPDAETRLRLLFSVSRHHLDAGLCLLISALDAAPEYLSPRALSLASALALNQLALFLDFWRTLTAAEERDFVFARLFCAAPRAEAAERRALVQFHGFAELLETLHVTQPHLLSVVAETLELATGADSADYSIFDFEQCGLTLSAHDLHFLDQLGRLCDLSSAQVRQSLFANGSALQLPDAGVGVSALSTSYFDAFAGFAQFFFDLRDIALGTKFVLAVAAGLVENCASFGKAVAGGELSHVRHSLRRPAVLYKAAEDGGVAMRVKYFGLRSKALERVLKRRRCANALQLLSDAASGADGELSTRSAAGPASQAREVWQSAARGAALLGRPQGGGGCAYEPFSFGLLDESSVAQKTKPGLRSWSGLLQRGKGWLGFLDVFSQNTAAPDFAPVAGVLALPACYKAVLHYRALGEEQLCFLDQRNALVESAEEAFAAAKRAAKRAECVGSLRDEAVLNARVVPHFAAADSCTLGERLLAILGNEFLRADLLTRFLRQHPKALAASAVRDLSAHAFFVNGAVGCRDADALALPSTDESYPFSAGPLDVCDARLWRAANAGHSNALLNTLGANGELFLLTLKGLLLRTLELENGSADLATNEGLRSVAHVTSLAAQVVAFVVQLCAARGALKFWSATCLQALEERAAGLLRGVAELTNCLTGDVAHAVRGVLARCSDLDVDATVICCEMLVMVYYSQWVSRSAERAAAHSPTHLAPERCATLGDISDLLDAASAVAPPSAAAATPLVDALSREEFVDFVSALFFLLNDELSVAQRRQLVLEEDDALFSDGENAVPADAPPSAEPRAAAAERFLEKDALLRIYYDVAEACIPAWLADRELRDLLCDRIVARSTWSGKSFGRPSASAAAAATRGGWETAPDAAEKLAGAGARLCLRVCRLSEGASVTIDFHLGALELLDKGLIRVPDLVQRNADFTSTIAPLLRNAQISDARCVALSATPDFAHCAFVGVHDAIELLCRATRPARLVRAALREEVLACLHLEQYKHERELKSEADAPASAAASSRRAGLFGFKAMFRAGNEGAAAKGGDTGTEACAYLGKPAAQVASAFALRQTDFSPAALPPDSALARWHAASPFAALRLYENRALRSSTASEQYYFFLLQPGASSVVEMRALPADAPLALEHLVEIVARSRAALVQCFVLRFDGFAVHRAIVYTSDAGLSHGTFSERCGDGALDGGCESDGAFLAARATGADWRDAQKCNALSLAPASFLATLRLGELSTSFDAVNRWLPRYNAVLRALAAESSDVLTQSVAQLCTLAQRFGAQRSQLLAPGCVAHFVPACLLQDATCWLAHPTLAFSLKVLEGCVLGNDFCGAALGDVERVCLKHALTSAHYAALLRSVCCPLSVVYSTDFFAVALRDQSAPFCCGWKRAETLPRCTWFNADPADVALDTLYADAFVFAQFARNGRLVNLLPAAEYCALAEAVPEVAALLMFVDANQLVVSATPEGRAALFDAEFFAGLARVLQAHETAAHADSIELFTCCRCHHLYHLHAALVRYVRDYLAAASASRAHYGVSFVDVPQFHLSFVTRDAGFFAQEYPGFRICAADATPRDAAFAPFFRSCLALANEAGELKFLVSEKTLLASFVRHFGASRGALLAALGPAADAPDSYCVLDVHFSRRLLSVQADDDEAVLLFLQLVFDDFRGACAILRSACFRFAVHNALLKHPLVFGLLNFAAQQLQHCTVTFVAALLLLAVALRDAFAVALPQADVAALLVVYLSAEPAVQAFARLSREEGNALYEAHKPSFARLPAAQLAFVRKRLGRDADASCAVEPFVPSYCSFDLVAARLDAPGLRSGALAKVAQYFTRGAAASPVELREEAAVDWLFATFFSKGLLGSVTSAVRNAHELVLGNAFLPLLHLLAGKSQLVLCGQPAGADAGALLCRYIAKCDAVALGSCASILKFAALHPDVARCEFSAILNLLERRAAVAGGKAGAETEAAATSAASALAAFEAVVRSNADAAGPDAPIVRPHAATCGNALTAPPLLPRAALSTTVALGDCFDTRCVPYSSALLCDYGGVVLEQLRAQLGTEWPSALPAPQLERCPLAHLLPMLPEARPQRRLGRFAATPLLARSPVFAKLLCQSSAAAAAEPASETPPETVPAAPLLRVLEAVRERRAREERLQAALLALAQHLLVLDSEPPGLQYLRQLRQLAELSALPSFRELLLGRLSFAFVNDCDSPYRMPLNLQSCLNWLRVTLLLSLARAQLCAQVAAAVRALCAAPAARSDDPLFQRLRDLLAQDVSHARVRSGAASVEAELVDAELLSFEVLNTLLLWKQQAATVAVLDEHVRRGAPYCTQMMMGQGKTTVLNPLTTLLLLNDGWLVCCVVPAPLLRFTQAALSSKLSRFFDYRVTRFAFDRYASFSAEDLALFRDFAARGGVVVTDAASVCALFLKFVEGCLPLQADPAASGAAEPQLAKLRAVAQFVDELGARERSAEAAFTRFALASRAPLAAALRGETHPSFLRELRRLLKRNVTLHPRSQRAADSAGGLDGGRGAGAVADAAELQRLATLFRLLRERGCFILDEVDKTMNPLSSEVRWPVGAKSSADRFVYFESHFRDAGLEPCGDALRPGFRWLVAMHFCELFHFAPQQLQCRCVLARRLNAPDAAELRAVQAEFLRAFDALRRRNLVAVDPHFALLDAEVYAEHFKPIVARWFVLLARFTGLLECRGAARPAERAAGTAGDARSRAEQLLLQCFLRQERFATLFERSYSGGAARNQFYLHLAEPASKQHLLLMDVWTNFLGFHFLTKRYNVNFGFAAPEPAARAPPSAAALTRRFLAAPYLAKETPSAASEFANKDLLAAYSFLSYFVAGLAPPLVLLCVAELRLRRSQENVAAPEQSAAARTYRVWVCAARGRVKGCADSDAPESLAPFERSAAPVASFSALDQTDFEDPHFVELICAHLRNSAHVVRFLLVELLLPLAVLESRESLVTNGFVLGSNLLCPRRLGYSGTPDEPLPADLGECHFAETGYVDMVRVLLSEAVCRCVVAEERDEGRATAALGEGSADALLRVLLQHECSVLIDAGALLPSLPNREVARAVLLADAAQRFREVLYFEQLTSQQKVLVRNDFNGQLHELSRVTSGSIADRFVFFDQLNSFGQDVMICSGATGLLTVGSDMSFRELVQGAWRLRQLGAGQKLVCYVPREVAAQLGDAPQLISSSPDTLTLRLLNWLLSASLRKRDAVLPLVARIDRHYAAVRPELQRVLAATAARSGKQSFTLQKALFVHRADQSAFAQTAPRAAGAEHGPSAAEDAPGLCEARGAAADYDATLEIACEVLCTQEVEIEIELQKEVSCQEPPQRPALRVQWTPLQPLLAQLSLARVVAEARQLNQIKFALGDGKKARDSAFSLDCGDYLRCSPFFPVSGTHAARLPKALTFLLVELLPAHEQYAAQRPNRLRHEVQNLQRVLQDSRFNVSAALQMLGFEQAQCFYLENAARSGIAASASDDYAVLEAILAEHYHCHENCPSVPLYAPSGNHLAVLLSVAEAAWIRQLLLRTPPAALANTCHFRCNLFAAESPLEHLVCTSRESCSAEKLAILKRSLFLRELQAELQYFNAEFVGAHELYAFRPQLFGALRAHGDAPADAVEPAGACAAELAKLRVLSLRSSRQTVAPEVMQTEREASRWSPLALLEPASARCPHKLYLKEFFVQFNVSYRSLAGETRDGRCTLLTLLLELVKLTHSFATLAQEASALRALRSVFGRFELDAEAFDAVFN